MRMGSDELAETILRLIHQAQQDAETRARERVTDFLDADSSLIAGRQMLGDRLRAATGTLQENLRNATEMMEKLQGMIRR